MKRYKVGSDAPHAVVPFNPGPISLGVVRSLGRAGVKVACVNHSLDHIHLHSRYCKIERTSRLPREDHTGMVRFLLAMAAELDDLPILIPTTDANVQLISEHREALAKGFRFAIPERDMIRTILDKRGQLEFAEQHGVHVPLTFYPTSAEEARSISKDCPYPVFLKPRSSIKWHMRFQRKGIVVRTPEELLEEYRRLASLGLEMMVQEIIPGASSNLVVTSGYFREGGAPVATFQHRKLRQFPPEFGVGSLTVSCRDEEALRVSLSFFRALRFAGIGEVELKRDPRDGELKLMEINPRSWTQISQPASALTNLPLIQYCDLAGLPMPEVGEFRAGHLWWDDWTDYLSFLELHRRGELTWKEWIRSWMGADDHAYFALDDPRPFLQMNGYGVGLIRRMVLPFKPGKVGSMPDPFHGSP